MNPAHPASTSRLTTQRPAKRLRRRVGEARVSRVMAQLGRKAVQPLWRNEMKKA